MQKKLIDGKENAYFSQKLVRLCDTVSCDCLDDVFSSEKYTYNFEAAAKILESFEIPAVAKSYEQLELTLNAKNNARAKAKANNHYNIKENEKPDSDMENTVLPSENVPQFTQAIQNNTESYKAITKLNELSSYISEYLKIADDKHPIAYDSETDDLNTFTCKMLGFSLCYERGKAVYVPIQQQSSQDLFSQTDYIELEDALKELMRLFQNPDVTIVLHNAKFDLKVLANHMDYKNKDLSKLELYFNKINFNVKI